MNIFSFWLCIIFAEGCRNYVKKFSWRNLFKMEDEKKSSVIKVKKQNLKLVKILPRKLFSLKLFLAEFCSHQVLSSMLFIITEELFLEVSFLILCSPELQSIFFSPLLFFTALQTVMLNILNWSFISLSNFKKKSHK